MISERRRATLMTVDTPSSRSAFGEESPERSLEWDLRRNKVLSDTAARLLKSDDPQELVETLCHEVMALLDCDLFFNFLVDGPDRLRLNVCAGIPADQARAIRRLQYGVAVCGCVARDGEPITVEDIQHAGDPRTELVREFGAQAYCCHPLKIGDRVIGTLSFGTRTRTRFTHDDIEVMRSVADLVANAMHRIERERELRRSEEDFARAQAVGQIGWWRLDTERDVLTWSPETYRIFGVTPGTPMTYEAFLEIVHPEDRAHVDEQWQAALAGRPYDLEHRLLVDGRPKWVRQKAYLEYENDRLLGGFGITQDITDRKQAEEALRTSESTSRQRLLDLEAFAYSLSHDLQAPLRAINAFSRAVWETSADKLDDAARGDLERVCAAGHRMAELLEAVLALSRTSRSELRRTRVDLTETAREIAASLAAAEPSRQVEFLIAPDLVVEADPALTRLLLQNLLGNAWKFTGNRPTARIEFACGATDAGEHAFVVRDDGPGFEMAYAEKIFAPFERLQPGEFVGLGMGLAIARQVVGRHGGRVWAESTPGRGARFFFTLPRSSVAA